jgi:hypothetical protein
MYFKDYMKKEVPQGIVILIGVFAIYAIGIYLHKIPKDWLSSKNICVSIVVYYAIIIGGYFILHKHT